MFGHSFGGAATASLMVTDPRVRAGINLDGTFQGIATEKPVTRPFMLVDSETAAQNPDRTMFLQRLEAIGYDAAVATAGHNYFGDLSLLFPLMRHYVPDLPPRAIELGSIDGLRAALLTRAYVEAFFDRHVLGRPAPVTRRAVRDLSRGDAARDQSQLTTRISPVPVGGVSKPRLEM